MKGTLSQQSSDLVQFNVTQRKNGMANTLLPIEEQNLTPDQVQQLDRRRSRGAMLFVIAGQFSIIAVVLLLWLVQDVVYAPGWAHPILYYFIFSLAVTGICGLSGAYLRRGAPEF
jgi:hypothetical protein